MKVLNIAEKASVAKEITSLLSRGARERLASPSKFNPVVAFPYNYRGREAQMIFTSVRGHVMELEFEGAYNDWRIPPIELFKAPIRKHVPPENNEIVQSLEKYARQAAELVLWLDCDREGEAIAFEVIEICQKTNPRITVRRATFSTVTYADITRALGNLGAPNQLAADAVETRQELDFRIGLSLTRLMTVRFKQKFEMPTKVISYGPCQFPTLGFVVARWINIQTFTPELFYFLSLSIKTCSQDVVKTSWKRYRVFDRIFALMLYQNCLLADQALVTDIRAITTKKSRPLPMNTVTMTKVAANKLHFAAHHTMVLAEALYNRGKLSYPRTETTSFSHDIDLRGLIRQQVTSNVFGTYARKLVEEDKFKWPRSGAENDQAHPPIHPVGTLEQSDCQQGLDEWRLYDMLSRYFLAACSDDARSQESTSEITYGSEKFVVKSRTVLEKNYLEILEPYDSWPEKDPVKFEMGQAVAVEALVLEQSQTTGPSLLSEAELIGRMHKYGVGTDATMHEHIRTIGDRQYVQRIVERVQRFRPTILGLALFEGYRRCSGALTKPGLRAETERAVTAIAEGRRGKGEVLENEIAKYVDLYNVVGSNLMAVERSLAVFFPGK